jgi:hypothetical protein
MKNFNYTGNFDRLKAAYSAPFMAGEEIFFGGISEIETATTMHGCSLRMP